MLSWTLSNFSLAFFYPRFAAVRETSSILDNIILLLFLEKNPVMITFNNVEHKWRILNVFALSTFDIFIWDRIFWSIIIDHSFIIPFIIVLPFPAKYSPFHALLYYYIDNIYNNNVRWNIFGLSRYSMDFLLQRSFRFFAFHLFLSTFFRLTFMIIASCCYLIYLKIIRKFTLIFLKYSSLLICVYFDNYNIGINVELSFLLYIFLYNRSISFLL